MHNLLRIYEKALPGLSWEERYTLAENAGYDFIELSIDKKRLNKLDYTDHQIQEVIDAAARHHMTIETMTLSANRYYPIGDKVLRNEGISIIKKAIVLAKKLGVKLIQLTAYDVYQKPSTSETRKLYEEGCVRLRNELERIRTKRELLQMIREDQLDAQMKMKLALILSGLTQEESLILMNEFMDKEAERFVILKKLRETENTNPS